MDTSTVENGFALAIEAHDQTLTDLGLEIWCGTEPTFTDRFSEAPEWLNRALGGDKEQRAAALLRALHRRAPGMVLRTVGRQYSGESVPRWSLGIYGRRDGESLWRGPPDPLLHAGGDEGQLQPLPDLAALQLALVDAFRTGGWEALAFVGTDDSRRLAFWSSDERAGVDEADPRLFRSSVHAQAIAPEGLRDELAEAGVGLLVLDTVRGTHGRSPCIELPGVVTTELYARMLEAIADGARDAGLANLVLRGYPPPVDASVQWTTITADPAVIEINMAPYPDVGALLAAKRDLYAAAAEVGLAPYRLHYNGAVADSGGGGQITLGGPSPEASPFFLAPGLLPALVRYFNHHPALSYLFAHDYLGSSGQAVRADERGREACNELRLALALRDCDPAPTPQRICAGLAQVLTDNCGNSHRAELNIEKLWNPQLAARGMQGLVEFRAFRMQHRPERAAALAALLRAVLAMLATRGFDAPLRDWGDTLHERFALPFYLEQDLRVILSDLEAGGVGLPAAVASELLRDDEFRDWTCVHGPGVGLTVRRAIDFWSLVGDVSAQERGDSRLVDSSTARIELCLRPSGGVAREEDFDGWQMAAGDLLLPLRDEYDPQGPAKLFALRYSSFVPWLGLHPDLGSQGPVRLSLFHPRRAQALTVELHEWRPDQAAYPGLPMDLEEARLRRRERCVIRPEPAPGTLNAPRADALTEYTLDLRWPAP